MNFQIEEDEIDIEALFAEVQLDDKNMYISDSDKATELVSKIIRRTESSANAVKPIRDKMEHLFRMCSGFSISGELSFYHSMIKLCDRLYEQQKIRSICNKTVIGLGGKYSAGKSKFINSISGIKNVLPENQNPTTSIPTYIISQNRNRYIANSVYGYSCELDKNAANALTHEFHDAYKIGFSSFVESIIVESADFSLDSKIALLDTPGYTKYDSKSNSKITASDKMKAFNQLKIVDYLIWLVDIDNGELTQDDIEFIQNLGIETPILIVCNKADKKTESEVRKIVAHIRKTVESLNFKCFGVTAYSSQESREYGGNMIEQFLKQTALDSRHKNDILSEFSRIEQNMKQNIQTERNAVNKSAAILLKYISSSQKILEIRSIAGMWSARNRLGYRLYILEKNYDKAVKELNQEITKYIGGEMRK